ncbi:MAG: hypothetical protein LLG04_18585 [Parachlamydia sp.]|nr:hypothetical protein [Parachlamydia sp.]
MEYIDRVNNIHHIEQYPKETPTKKRSKSPSALKSLVASAEVVKNFVVSTQLARKVRSVSKKVDGAAGGFFRSSVKPFADYVPIKVEGIRKIPGELLFTANFFAGFATAVGGIVNVISLVKAGRMLKRGISMVYERKEGPAHPLRRGYWEYGKSLIKTGKRDFALYSASLVTNVQGLMQSAAQMAAIAQPAAGIAAAAIVQIGTVAVAPIAFCLSAYGAKVNIEGLGKTSAQLVLLREELDRLEALKIELGVNRFTDETVMVDCQEVNLREREEIIRFALRRIGDKRINHIVDIVMNSLFMAAAVFSIGSVVSGPAGVVFSSLTLVCLVAGGGGALLTRGILAALRHRRKMKQKREMGYAVSGPRYISSKQMLAKAERILSVEYAKGVSYKEKSSLAQMGNGEMLAYLLRGTSTRLTLEETRGAFFAGDEHYWKRAFA